MNSSAKEETASTEKGLRVNVTSACVIQRFVDSFVRMLVDIELDITGFLAFTTVNIMDGALVPTIVIFWRFRIWPRMPKTTQDWVRKIFAPTS